MTMASEIETRAHPFPTATVWPPDDTEESILGTDLHQTTILNLRWGLNEAAHLAQTPGQPLPWQALDQIELLGCQRPDGTAYRTYPDVFVYTHGIDPRRGSVALALDGPPLLIVEVLSESTDTVDLNLERGKGYSYARAGVQEYVTLDPTGAYVPEGLRAWRLEEGVYRPWRPDGQGRWQSAHLPIALGLEGVLAAVYTRAGRRMHREGEVEVELVRREAEAARREAEAARREAEAARREAEAARELARRDEELAELRRLLDEYKGTP